MSRNVYDILKERGFVEAATDEDGVREFLSGGGRSVYIGFDATAPSLHVGSLLPIMALVHLQRAGHRPIVIIGGGTTMVGDPSGKTETRRILSLEEIDGNARSIQAEVGRYIDFSGGRALLLNNVEWLAGLNYIEFLRDIGSQFSVNRMLTFDCFKSRLDKEQGLSFLEFNYMLLQSYDFLHLSDRYDCHVQMGGSDQWGNIVAGMELIRRLRGRPAYGTTFPLLKTAGGQKMGKTEKGAVWLDPGRTSPYDFYQYWVNVDDRDVGRFLACFTLLPLEEVRSLSALQGADLRRAKEVLAYEATRLNHGEEAATRSQVAARALFRGDGGDADEDAAPTTVMPRSALEAGIPIIDLLSKTLTRSRNEARRLIAQGGAYLNGVRVETAEMVVAPEHAEGGRLVLRAGKKKHHRVVFE